MFLGFRAGFMFLRTRRFAVDGMLRLVLELTPDWNVALVTPCACSAGANADLLVLP